MNRVIDRLFKLTAAAAGVADGLASLLSLASWNPGLSRRAAGWHWRWLARTRRRRLEAEARRERSESWRRSVAESAARMGAPRPAGEAIRMPAWNAPRGGKDALRFRIRG